jgi:hypothetical protein
MQRRFIVAVDRRFQGDVRARLIVVAANGALNVPPSVRHLNHALYKFVAHPASLRARYTLFPD